MHVDHVSLRIEMMLPDIFKEHRASDHLIGVTCEILQQPEFLSLQLDWPSGPRYPMREEVEAQIGDRERRLNSDAPRSANQRFEPS